MKRRNALISASVAISLSSSACAPARPTAVEVTQTAWTSARADLTVLRKSVVEKPYVEVIRVAVREPRSGRVLEGRGAVAVDPHRAMRMILLGPGGRTALDVWVTRDRWRFSVPALDTVRRGSAKAKVDDLPIGFFQWWFLEPIEGRLLTIDDTPAGRTFVLREDDATVFLHQIATRPDARKHFIATRRQGTEVDQLEWVARSLRPGPGDRARYKQEVTGLEVDVLVESVSPDPPDAAAFLDPDDPGVAL